MPQTPLIFYRDDDSSVPVLDWLGALPAKARDKCRVRLERLHECGHELRVRLGTVNYRMLYFFHDRIAAVVSHGLVKEDTVPAREIYLARQRQTKFNANPRQHTAGTADL